MSLFGNLNNSGTSGSNTPANTAGGGLFGNLNKPTPSTGGGLFGSGTTTPQASTTGGLFGASTNAQPQTSGGLFGGLGLGSNTTSQPATTSTGGSLFGGGNTTTTPAQPQTNSLFGDPNKPSLSLFGNTTASTPTMQGQPAATNMLSGSTLGGSLFGNTVTQAPNANPSQQHPPPTGAFFDSLLAKSKRHHIEGDASMEDLPSLQLGLGDLRQRLKKLGPKATTGDRQLDGRAHYLLAASGVDPGSAVRDLGSLGFQSSRFDRSTYGAPQGEMDVETYLSNLQNKTTLSMIADGLERSVRDFDAFLEDNVTMEWEAQRNRIYEHFGIKPKQTPAGGAGATPGRDSQGGFGRSRRSRAGPSSPNRATNKASVFGRSGLGKSVIGTPSRIGPHPAEFSDVTGPAAGGTSNGGGAVDDRFLREKQNKLAEKIHQLNDTRQQAQAVSYPILNELADVESKSGDRHAEHLVDAYRAMVQIVGENPDADSPGADATASERQFSNAYLDPNTNSVGGMALRKRILAGANRFLEMKFMDQVEQQIARNPQNAQLGGRPDVTSKVKAYVRLLSQGKHLAPDNTDLQSIRREGQEEFVWAIIFYLLRSGHVNEAATYVNENSNHFKSIDRSFPGFISSFASSEDRRLKRPLQDRCNTEFSQRIRNAPENSIDPYRAACYKIVGRCELSNRSFEGFNADVYDWMWLQFNLAREGDRSVEIAGEMFGLSEVQNTIREVGMKYFPKNNADGANGNFGMFFFMQIMSGMFEQAIAYLYSFAYVDAVHFAIALEYYGLLRASDSITSNNDLLTHSTRGLPQISFGRMLGYYTRDFRAGNVAAAVDYIILICLNLDDPNPEMGKQHAELCHEALRELVLETREFSKLIGDIRPDGQRIPGIIETRGSLIGLPDQQEFVRSITLQAARFANDNGRTTDAVLLYHLAEDYDTVVAIVGRALSEAISLEVGGEAMRLQPVKPRIEGAQPEVQSGNSLSLAAIDDPVELAQTMMQMYERDRFFRERIQDVNRTACGVLLQMSEIKSLVGASQWMLALDEIKTLEILPLEARGDPTAIRAYAAKFASLPQSVSANVGNLLMWTVVCCTRQRDRLASGQFSGNEGTSRDLQVQLKQMSLDLTTYTSQLRYRFPSSLLEALARASAD
ncbi:Nucleoporin NIC96 [Cytospora mali]|uniref:Nucleoporin NIC96 n=1 Tax=Cytospora mali TaxID=578113 RepID=A0A194V9Y2_CYTMA|nr:Nucleoporin NIC96 [Valsa mali var. pyri (nom. inval.)]